jgi:hypothetical protein
MAKEIALKTMTALDSPKAARDNRAGYGLEKTVAWDDHVTAVMEWLAW